MLIMMVTVARGTRAPSLSRAASFPVRVTVRLGLGAQACQSRWWQSLSPTVTRSQPGLGQVTVTWPRWPLRVRRALITAGAAAATVASCIRIVTVFRIQNRDDYATDSKARPDSSCFTARLCLHGRLAGLAGPGPSPL